MERCNFKRHIPCIYFKGTEDMQSTFDFQHGLKNNNNIFKIDVDENRNSNSVITNPTGAGLDKYDDIYTPNRCKCYPFNRSMSEGMVLFKERQCNNCA